MSGFSFDLIDQPWIDCAGPEGSEKVGLRKLLARSHELREIESHNPLTVAALLRVLLALVHRIVDGPRTTAEWAALYKAGRLPADRIDDYFRKFGDRFDLFSESRPFYQTPGLSILDGFGKPAPVSAAVMMLERASGNNKTIFDHTTDSTPVMLTPAQAAQALITAQMYSLGGLNKKTTYPFDYQQSYLHAPMVSGIFILLTGDNLFETLMLNLLLPGSHAVKTVREDRPVWERDDLGGTGAKAPNGYLDFLTGKCRHIRLVPEWSGESPVVSRVHIAQAEAFPEVENPGFYKKKNGKTGDWYVPQLDVERLLWRDSTALFAFDSGTDHRPAAFRQVMLLARTVPLRSRYRCVAIALANDKANPLAWRKEVLSVPLSLLEDKGLVPLLRSAMDRAENVAGILDASVKRFMRETLPENSKDVNEKARATGSMRVYWDRLEGHFNDFLLSIEEGDAALATWYGRVRSAALYALRTCVRQRYADSAKSYAAWAAAMDEFHRRLAGIK